jgi:hypothetical protein
MKILPIRKSTKKKREAQVADLEILAKIIPIVATHAFLIKKEFLLNKKSMNHKKTNSKYLTTTSDLTLNKSFSLWMNYWVYHI